ncbi:MAG: hypothetical protein GW876_13085, partial [Bacteroidetes bacterium]|nr:hypothetical protein [Bacteroidota bacterium]
NVLPTATITPDNQSICAGASATLTASGGSGATPYNWSTGNSTAVITVTPLSTTTYIVTVTDVNGCSNTTSSTVTINSLPSINAGADQTVCAGTSVTLSGSGTATSYTWDNGVTDGISFIPVIGTLTYTVTGTDANSCSNTDQVIVTVNEVPTLSIGTIDATCGTTDGSATVTASGGTGSYTYQWDANAANQTTALASNLGVGSYIVTVFDGNCSATATANISETGAPTITVSTNDTTICEGQTIFLSVVGADSYTWAPATYLNTTTGSLVNATPLSSIIYTVTGTTGGCSAIQSININVNPVYNLTANAAICDGDSILLGGAYQYVSGTYTDVYVSINGCDSTIVTTLTVNPLPIAGYTYVDNGFGSLSFTDASLNATA